MIAMIKQKILSIGHSHNPTWLGLVIDPFYLARKSLWCAVREFASHLHGQLLDVGCGTKPYEDLFAVAGYVGLDIESGRTKSLGRADDLYDGKRFPYEDTRFDSILCNQVLEHVFNPDEFLGEMRRVMKPGGKLLMTLPFLWDEHEQPYDYARYTTFGLKALLERNGFKIIVQRKLLADASLFCQLINAYVFKAWRTRIFALNVFLTVAIVFPLNLLGILVARILPRNPDMFLDQVVLAEKL